MKKYSEACERNRAPILEVLKRAFANSRHVLEVGSGTGQHAAYFAPQLPHLVWQASDVAENLPDIREWVLDPPPIELDMDKPWPALDVDAVFSANTCHIMSWPQVERMFAGIGRLRPKCSRSMGRSITTAGTPRRATRVSMPCCAGAIR